MPEIKTSGQPMDQWAGTCGSSEFGNPAPGAVENVATPLTGSKGPEAVPLLNSAQNNMQSMTKGGDKSVPTFGVDEMMQMMSGPRH